VIPELAGASLAGKLSFSALSYSVSVVIARSSVTTRTSQIQRTFQR
jgi:hypothetical protein